MFALGLCLFFRQPAFVHVLLPALLYLPLLQTNFLSHILLCFNACCWSVIMYLVLIALISSDFCPRRILTLVPQWDYFYHRK